MCPSTTTRRYRLQRLRRCIHMVSVFVCTIVHQNKCLRIIGAVSIPGIPKLGMRMVGIQRIGILAWESQEERLEKPLGSTTFTPHESTS
jgi:hypothetical protein